MIDSLVKELFGSILAISIDKWKGSEQFRALRLVAQEKIYRELRWNLECLASSKVKDQAIYLKALRMEAFVELSSMGAPIDDIFTVNIKSVVSSGPKPSARILKILDKDEFLSSLLDRTYNRIEILRLRLSEDLPCGDISYLRTLTALCLDGIKSGRKELRQNRK